MSKRFVVTLTEAQVSRIQGLYGRADPAMTGRGATFEQKLIASLWRQADGDFRPVERSAIIEQALRFTREK